MQTGKAVFGHRRAQVVADAALMLEELRRRHHADQMHGLLRPGRTAAVPVVTGERIRAAGLQLAAEDVQFIRHQASVAHDPCRQEASTEG